MSASRFCMLLAVYLLLSGVWGLFSPTVFGIFTTDTLHAVIELALGATGIWASSGPRVYPYLISVGALVMVVGAMRFIPGLAELVIRLLNVNPALAIANLVVGAVAVGIGMGGTRSGLGAATR